MADQGPLILNKFPGLNYGIDPTLMGTEGAQIAHNVEIDRVGELRTRKGTTALEDFTGVGVSASFYGDLIPYNAADAFNSQQLVIKRYDGTDFLLEAYSTSGGTALASLNLGPAESNWMRGVQFGTPTAEYIYMANAITSGIKRYDGTSFTTVVGSPAASLVALWPRSNRLVANDTTTDSLLTFSDAGDAETFSGNTIELTPGDGSGIIGLVTWQDYLFAFKRDRYFVFTSEGTEDDGTPIFDYYTVDGHGSLVHPVAGPDGVYFFDGQSIWVTAGDTPKRISQPIDAILRGEATDVFGLTGGSSSFVPFMSYSQDKLYIAGLTSSILTYIYDSRTNTWATGSWRTNGSMPISVATFKDTVGFTYSLMAMFHLTGPWIAKEDASATDDVGEPFDCTYQWGYADPFGDKRVSVRKAIVLGYGGANLIIANIGQRSNDLGGSSLSASFTLEPTTSNPPTEDEKRMVVRGIMFAPKLFIQTIPSNIKRVEIYFRAPEVQD